MVAASGSAPPRPLNPASIASQKRVAPARPTMRSAPLTWCMWPGQGCSRAPFCGSAPNFAICSRTTVRAWLTSAVIHDSSVESGFNIGSLRHLEVRYRALQAVRERREALRGRRGLLRAFRGQLGDRENRLHVRGDLGLRSRSLMGQVLHLTVHAGAQVLYSL